MKNYQKYILIFFLAISFFFSINKINASDTAIVNAVVRLSVCNNGIKENGEQCDLNSFTKTCPALGFSGGTLTCSTHCDFDVSNCFTNSTAQANTVFVPNTDTTYLFPNAGNTFTISLPEGFYKKDLSFFIFSHENSDFILSKPVPTGQNFVGKIYELIFLDENGEIVSNLNKESTITLSYADLNLGSIDENSLIPYRNESGSSSWSAISDFTQDKNNKTITFTTSDFSFFTIMGSLFHINPPDVPGVGHNNLPKISLEEKKRIIKIADFNNDGRVDIIDLSILLYHYENPDIKNDIYDLNKDGKIDLFDISIMLYYWNVTS